MKANQKEIIKNSKFYMPLLDKVSIYVNFW